MDINTNNAFRELMEIRGGSGTSGAAAAQLSDTGVQITSEVTVSGQDPFFPSPFKFGETAAGVLAARAVAANDLWELRTGRRQNIELSVETAAATCLGGTAQTQRKNSDGVYEGIQASEALQHMVSITQPWKCADGRWFLPHFNLPHLEKKVLDVLGHDGVPCKGTPEAVAEAVSKWNSEDLDRAIYEAGATGGIVFTQEEWLQHPHGKHLASLPVITIEKIADSEPIPLPAITETDDNAQPLSGVKVLELCRILAGPTCGISLAEHGADVLMVTAPQLPQAPNFVRDVSHGKRSCFLDYTVPEASRKLHELVKDADIFLEGYRPGSMEKHGFGPKDLLKDKKGLIYVSVDCFGPGGVYSDRAGWDQVAQAVTGIAITEGELEKVSQPTLTPVYACDFLTGFMGAFGAMVALKRRALEGGSYVVHVSLCQSAMLLQREGLASGFENAPGKLDPETFESLAVCDDGTIYGDLKTLGPVIRMSETNPRWNGTTPELGSSEAAWW